MSRRLLFLPLLLAVSVVVADDVPEIERAADTSEPEDTATAPDARVPTEEDAKLVSGMSVLGNREAPKSLVIVPWKSSQIGDSLGISPMLDDSTQPVDREVFLRALSYYEIRSKKTP